MQESRFRQVIELIDAANREDPNRETVNGEEIAKELLYSVRMTEQLNEFAPDASEALRIAVRAQHLCRWRIPRSDYPRTRPGYLKWRRDLGRFHAEQTAALMNQVGYDREIVETVSNLLMKKAIKQSTETQTLEDVACLVFVRYYLEDFAQRHNEDKLLGIIRKTWAKMSTRGREAIQQLQLPQPLSDMLGKALSQPER